MSALSLIAWFESLLRKLWPRPAGGLVDSSGEPIDPELREIFLTELGEVTRAQRVACTTLLSKPSDQEAMKCLRRGFHTIKGSAPLVDAIAIGKFCAQLEVSMTRLAETPSKLTPETIRAVEQAVALLPLFGQAIAAGRRPPSEARAVADRVRRQVG